MLTYKEISLQDKECFDSFFRNHNYENSEFSFTNLFIWRHSYSIQFCTWENTLFIMGRYKKNFPFLMPPLFKNANDSCQRAMEMLIHDCKARGIPFLMKSVTEAMKEKIERDCPGYFIFEEDPDNDDYIYNSEDLISLKGKKYHSKRNHINQFIRKYNYEYCTMTNEHLEECKIACLLWFSNRSTGIDDDLEDEKAAVLEALQYMDSLQLKGGIIRVDGRLEGFSLGELLNPNMALIHIEKANPDISGLYAMINQKFAEDCWSQIPYINREEDMGIPGLRKSKHSYYPVRMVKKYNAFLK